MAPKQKSRQSAAARVVSRPKTGPLSQVASGIQHTPNPVHPIQPTPQPPLIREPTPADPSNPYAASNLVGVLGQQGIQASTTPHPNDVGWGDYGNGLWVYAPQGPGQVDPLSDTQRGNIASLTDPYLADSFKQTALQSLGGMAPSTIPDSASGGADKTALLQAIQQQMIDKGQTVPDSVTQQLGQTQTPVVPAPTENTAAIPAPIANSAPTSTVVTAPPPVDTAQNPFGSAAPPSNLLANRSLPGFAAVHPQPSQHPAHPMVGFGNLGNIAQRMLQGKARRR